MYLYKGLDGADKKNFFLSMFMYFDIAGALDDSKELWLQLSATQLYAKAALNGRA